MTKIYSVGFNHDAELSYKSEFKGLSPSGATLIKRIKKSDLSRKYWAKNSRPRQLHYLKLSNGFAVSTEAHLYAKISFIAHFRLDLLHIF